MQHPNSFIINLDCFGYRKSSPFDYTSVLKHRRDRSQSGDNFEKMTTTEGDDGSAGGILLTSSETKGQGGVRRAFVGINWRKSTFISRDTLLPCFDGYKLKFLQNHPHPLHKPQQIVSNVKMFPQMDMTSDAVSLLKERQDDVGSGSHLKQKLLAMIIAPTVVQLCQSTVNKVKGDDDSLTVTTFGW